MVFTSSFIGGRTLVLHCAGLKPHLLTVMQLVPIWNMASQIRTRQNQLSGISGQLKSRNDANRKRLGGRTSVLHKKDHCAGLKPRLHSLRLIMNMLVDEDLGFRMEG